MKTIDAVVLHAVERVSYFAQDHFGIISYVIAKWCYYVVGATTICYWGVLFLPQLTSTNGPRPSAVSILLDVLFLLIVSREIGYLKKSIAAWHEGRIRSPSPFSTSPMVRLFTFLASCYFGIIGIAYVLFGKTASISYPILTVQTIALCAATYFGNVCPRPPHGKTVLKPAPQ